MIVSRKGLTSAVVAVSVVLAAGACSSSKSSSSGASATTSGSSSSAAAKGTPVTVGVVCTCSGAFGAQEADGEKTVQAWADMVNASGGVGGHPIHLILKDDAGSPGTSVSDAESLVASHVAVIFDNSLFDEAWQKEVDAANIPVVGGNFSTTPYYQDPNWYPTGQTNDSIVYANVATAKASGGTKIGILYCAESVQCQQSVPPTKTAAGQLGVTLAYSASISMTAPNYTAQCVAAQQAGVNALIILDGPTTVERVAANCAQQNYNPGLIAEGTGYAPQIATSTGLKDHYWGDFPIRPFFASGPEVTQMNAAMDKYEPGVRQQPAVWSVVAVQGWTGGLAIGQAIKAANVPAGTAVTAADITRGLDTFSNQTLGGWSPPLTFTAGKPHPVDCWYTARVLNGVPALVNGGKLTCHPSTGA